MPSKAREELATRLDDVDELISAHGFVTGGERGAPLIINGRRQGRALVRAGIVLLCAAAEAYIEDIFDEADLPGDAPVRLVLTRSGHPGR